MFHIITPFSRPWNLPVLREMFAAMPDWVLWYPFAFIGKPGDHCCGVFTIPEVLNWDPCCAKLNAAVEYPPIFGGLADYIGFLCDDDWYPPNFFDGLKDATAEVLIVPAVRHGGNSGPYLEAKPENMRRCHVGLEQFFVRADIMRQFRFNNSPTADGELIEALWARNRDGFAFYPNNPPVHWNKLPGKEPT